jgi:hypothetical protein
MLANDDFDVHTELTGAAENLYHAPSRRHTPLGITHQLDIHHGTVKFRHRPVCAPGLVFREAQFVAQSVRQLLTRRNYNFVMNARIVR